MIKELENKPYDSLLWTFGKGLWLYFLCIRSLKGHDICQKGCTVVKNTRIPRQTVEFNFYL